MTFEEAHRLRGGLLYFRRIVINFSQIVLNKILKQAALTRPQSIPTMRQEQECVLLQLRSNGGTKDRTGSGLLRRSPRTSPADATSSEQSAWIDDRGEIKIQTSAENPQNATNYAAKLPILPTHTMSGTSKGYHNNTTRDKETKSKLQIQRVIQAIRKNHRRLGGSMTTSLATAFFHRMAFSLFLALSILYCYILLLQESPSGTATAPLLRINHPARTGGATKASQRRSKRTMKKYSPIRNLIKPRLVYVYYDTNNSTNDQSYIAGPLSPSLSAASRQEQKFPIDNKTILHSPTLKIKRRYMELSKQFNRPPTDIERVQTITDDFYEGSFVNEQQQCQRTALKDLHKMNCNFLHEIDIMHDSGVYLA